LHSTYAEPHALGLAQDKLIRSTLVVKRGGGRLRGAPTKPRQALRQHPVRGNDEAAPDPRPTEVPADGCIRVQHGATKLPVIVDLPGREVLDRQRRHGIGQPGVLRRIITERADVDGSSRHLNQPPQLPVGGGRHCDARHGGGAAVWYPGVPYGRSSALFSARGPDRTPIVLPLLAMRTPGTLL